MNKASGIEGCTLADDRCSPSILIMPSPCNPDAQVALDGFAVWPVEVGGVVGNRKQADALGQGSHHAGTDLERSGAIRDGQGHRTEPRLVGGIEAVPEVGLQVWTPGRRAVLEDPLQPCKSRGSASGLK